MKKRFGKLIKQKRNCRILGRRLVSLVSYFELSRISSQKCDIKNFCRLPFYLIYVFHLFYPNKLRFSPKHDCNHFNCATDAVYFYQEGNGFSDTERRNSFSKVLKCSWTYPLLFLCMKQTFDEELNDVYLRYRSKISDIRSYLARLQYTRTSQLWRIRT